MLKKIENGLNKIINTQTGRIKLVKHYKNGLVDGEIKYYIQAIDISGRYETYPIAGYFSFDAVGGVPVQNGDINMDDIINNYTSVSFFI